MAPLSRASTWSPGCNTYEAAPGFVPVEENELTTSAPETSDCLGTPSDPCPKTLSFDEGVLDPNSNTESESDYVLDGPNNDMPTFRDRACSWQSEGSIDIVALPVYSFQSVRTYNEFDENEEGPHTDIPKIEDTAFNENEEGPRTDIPKIEETAPMPADASMPDPMPDGEQFIHSPVMQSNMQPWVFSAACHMQDASMTDPLFQSPVTQPYMQPPVFGSAHMQWAQMPWQQLPAMSLFVSRGVGAMPQNQVQAAAGSGTSSNGRTTAWWGSFPNNYTRDELMALLDDEGFGGWYDFFYAPYDFSNDAMCGYAFINFLSAEKAGCFICNFTGFNRWTKKSMKVSVVKWSKKLQGLESHVERYRSSPVMHPDVPDEVKPVLLRDGQRIPFAPPTKRIRAPHLKDCRKKA